MTPSEGFCKFVSPNVDTHIPTCQNAKIKRSITESFAEGPIIEELGNRSCLEFFSV
jgi:hypothetical protein